MGHAVALSSWVQLCDTAHTLRGHKKPAKHFIYALPLVVCLESFRIKRAEFAKLCAMKMSFAAKTGKTLAKKRGRTRNSWLRVPRKL